MEEPIDAINAKNLEASNKMEGLRDALGKRGYSGRNLEVSFMRFLYCVLAGPAGLFGKDAFLGYIEGTEADGSNLSEKIRRLFDALSPAGYGHHPQSPMPEKLFGFKRVPGILFDGKAQVPGFDGEMRELLMDFAKFDWGSVSPDILGTMFQAVVENGIRREKGIHYTSEAIILKLINPLFMDDLKAGFEMVRNSHKDLVKFHENIAKLRFLDPACGCGNFLITSYRELRLLEIDILKTMKAGFGAAPDTIMDSPLKVGIGQFYGIECNGMSCELAKLGMLLMERKMDIAACKELSENHNRKEVETNTTITCANALSLDWGTVVGKGKLSYIIGNPPFIGYTYQSLAQKKDMQRVCGIKKLDYVAAWFFKASDYIKNTGITCAFVSTNSITQGEQATAIWEPLMGHGIFINFFVKAFKWQSDVKSKATVQCVIIGISYKKPAQNINQYLINAPTIFIKKRKRPICDVPAMLWGNKPVDGGHFTLSEKELLELTKSQPAARKYIRKLYGAQEFINNTNRYCLWLVDADEREIKTVPLILERIEKVKEFRTSSKKEATRKAAATPTLFLEIRQPDCDYILIPSVTSEKRDCIPIDFVASDIIVNNSVHIIPHSSIYHFGILTSSVHMAWVKTVCGRLEMRYRYSEEIVYNNFPWPEANEIQIKAIEKAAKEVLKARSLFPDKTLGYLYNPLSMPDVLSKAHKNLDLSVMDAYGMPKKSLDSDIMAILMEMYQMLTSKSYLFQKDNREANRSNISSKEKDDISLEPKTNCRKGKIDHIGGLPSQSHGGNLKHQSDINAKAALMMANLHDGLAKLGLVRHDLEELLLRLLFCCFIDHNGILEKRTFYRYLENTLPNGTDLSSKLESFFDNFGMPDNDPCNHIKEHLKTIRDINRNVPSSVPPLKDFGPNLRELLLECSRFDWSKINPAIFGSMFQGVMDKTKRREIGAHYTSEENILKLIKPLFLESLRKEFEKIKSSPKEMSGFHDKLCRLHFFDPACGCGNFLIITYRELKKLENNVLTCLKAHNEKPKRTNSQNLHKVSLNQFYGIDSDDFACQIAKVCLFLAYHQTNSPVSAEVVDNSLILNNADNATIINDNALRLDWESLIPKDKSTIVFGNPPFVGYSNQTQKQKDDTRNICGHGKVDYVAAWFFKAANYIKDTSNKCAFVATNSITQGEQATAIWKPLFEQGMFINFSIPGFKWGNDAKTNAGVYCVIIGFSSEKSTPNINQYLIAAPSVFIESRKMPICDVPMMVWGNKPVDGGYLMLTARERAEFISQNPQTQKYIRRLFGADDYINNTERYCLWLVDADPNDLEQIPQIMERIEKVKKFRLSSKKIGTQKCANFPTRFMEIRQPDCDYIIIPRVSSEKRHYIPIGFVPPEIIVNSSVHVIPGKIPLLYHFGILTSSVHMAWVRTVCGRLEMRYRYSKNIVYNNFPWPNVTDNQKEGIVALAKDVLAARTIFPDKTLAELYDPATMPKPLLKAHQGLDLLVMEAYKISPKNITESDILTKLMQMYQMKTSEKSQINKASPKIKTLHNLPNLCHV